MKTNEEIDIVIIWVDGNDPEWLRVYNEYAPHDKQLSIDISQARFRDWGCLRYWFRGIEQFAPWARKVHFVTSGQRPDWLNLDCPKLNWVRHEDYIPHKYLPTFNANPIEDNLHRIEGLAERFVFFNDDFYLIAPTPATRFFRQGQPTDMAVCNTLQSDGLMGHITLNDLNTINHHFRKRKVLQDISKWFTPTYGSYLLRTFALLPWPRFSGFFDHHLPQGFCKSTFQEVWEAEPDLLHRTSTHRFRHIEDVNQWLFRYWHLCKGEFAPINMMRDSAIYHLTDVNFEEAVQTIYRQEKRILVLNDSEGLSDFETKKERVRTAFETILPTKSSFEK